jgi:heterodisulfide reductase subunit B
MRLVVDMETIPYFPGCTCKADALPFEVSAKAVMRELGYELAEWDRWTCCGTVHSMASDDLIHHLGPARNLIRVQEEGSDRMVTICSMCYATLSLSARLFDEDEEKMDKLNDFLYDEENYRGGIRVMHLLELLRDDVGWDAIKDRVKRPLKGLRVAPYYGCTLVRPVEVGIDDREHPAVMEDLLKALGATVVDSPFKVECCGSYETVNRPDLVAEKCHRILSDAVGRGADLVITSCPLCEFNLDDRQDNITNIVPNFPGIPVLYFTSLVALAFDLPREEWGLESATVDPMPALEAKVLSPEEGGGD